jgi:heme oxygenase
MAATSQLSPDTLRFRLREATAGAHKKVETAMALEERCADLPTYRALLADLWGLYAPLEARLATLQWDAVGIDFRQRTKTPWLHADLTILGASEFDIGALPRAVDLPSIQCTADGFGALYVLEGASLGGQIILRRIKSELGLDQSTGARFFSSYGADVGERWRCFVATMTAFGITEDRVQAMERAALATFDTFRLWLGDRQ